VVRKALGYLALALLAAIALTPFVWMVSTSLKNVDEVFLFPPKWIPDQLLWKNFTSLWDDFPMTRWLFNSIFVTFAVVIGRLFICSLAAYSFARLRFRWRDTLFYIYLATMMIPGEVLLVPNFVLMRDLGWLNTYWALIIPPISNAFGVFLLRQYFLGLPRELEDAARVDGASYWHIYRKIILPLSRAPLATLGAFTFIELWGSFLWPLIVIDSPDKMTLPVGLALLNDVHSTDWTRLMAGDVIALIPLLVVYLAAQRYFVRSISLTGIKG